MTAILTAAGPELQTLEIPAIEELLTTRTKHYPYTKSFDEVCDDPLVVMHTSGSTGFPKPISWTHGFCAAYATSLSLSPPPGFESVDKLYEGNRIFVMFPPFHVSPCDFPSLFIESVVYQPLKCKYRQPTLRMCSSMEYHSKVP